MYLPKPNFSTINKMSQKPHFLLVTFPAQGHINPALQFATHLIRNGAQVTLATTIFARLRITTKGSIPDGFSFASFSDGFDDGFKLGDAAFELYLSEFERRGSETLADLIVASKKENRPFTFLVYTLFIPWATKVARGFNLPSALLWVQPAIVFDVYYYYFNGYSDVISKDADDKNPSRLIKLPGLPPLTARAIPSFLIPSTVSYALTVRRVFQQQIDTLLEETNPVVLVNTFDALEPEALKSIDRIKMIGIGPLIPSDNSFRAHLFQNSKKESNYMEWLDSNLESSVIYISFGTVFRLSKQQIEELARGLLDSGRPFLWVIRDTKPNGEKEEEKMIISCEKELEEQGIIVSWCSQVEVLSHSSVGCFLTHCGWNSSLESLVCGVPMVAFPQWIDQETNAKLIEDTWKTGVRVTAAGNGIVESEEIKRCLDLVMGEKGEELRRNAKEWKDLAKEATKEGGSSYENLKAFVGDIDLD